MEHKYLKYKKKYLNLKNNIKNTMYGGYLQYSQANEAAVSGEEPEGEETGVEEPEGEETEGEGTGDEEPEGEEPEGEEPGVGNSEGEQGDGVPEDDGESEE